VDEAEEEGQEEGHLHHRPVGSPRREGPGDLHVRAPFRRRYGPGGAAADQIGERAEATGE